MIRYSIISTDMGWVGIAYSSKGLIRFVLPSFDREEVLGELLEPGWIEAAGQDYAPEIQSYFKGEKVKLDFAVDWSWATPFQKKVLEYVMTIPYGKTETYGYIAQQIGSPKAARAVGGALGKNQVPLIVPCHRVLAAGGAPGGFSSRNGLKDKFQLLSLEGIV